ncbi:unnamed protein product, partial [Didymodactylos carnosus]
FNPGVKRSTPDDYNIYGQFELYIVDNVEQLMKKRRPDEQDIKIVLHDEQLFDCINDGKGSILNNPFNSPQNEILVKFLQSWATELFALHKYTYCINSFPLSPFSNSPIFYGTF